MGTYVMSDLHGRYDRYKQMLELISFSETDTLYILGDCIDRGVAGVSILLDVLQRNNIHLLLGNHEQMMIDALVKGDRHWCDVWGYNGCSTTILEYNRISDSDKERVREFLITRPVQEMVAVGGRAFYLVHGAPPGTHAPHRFSDAHMCMLWDKMPWNGPVGDVPDGATVVFGHVCTKHYQAAREHYKVYFGNRRIGIDCGCAYPNAESRLGCLRLDDMQEYYVH